MLPRTPNYVLDRPHTFYRGGHDSRTLPAGSFVRPIELKYVPAHILDDEQWRWFNKEREVFCFTRYGIIPIPKEYLRET